MQFRATKELSTQECEEILKKENISTSELQQLIDAKLANHIDFNLVDVRELTEWYSARIKHVNYLVPTSEFYQKVQQIEKEMNKATIVYCHVGQRSAYCQKVMYQLGFMHVVNVLGGIAAYTGDLDHGE